MLWSEYKHTSELSYRKLKSFEEILRDLYAERLETSSMFLVPVNLQNPFSVQMYEQLVREVSAKLNFYSTGINLRDVPRYSVNSDDILLQQLFFENINPDSVKNTLLNIFRDLTGTTQNSRLHKYGLFIPRTGKISCYTFLHGGYYRFRLATFKLKFIHTSLRDYLLSLPSNCPNEYFFSGPRASGLKFPLNADMINTENHEIISTTADAVRERILSSEHEDVEKYFLHTDPAAIASEIPVWLEPEEMENLGFLRSPFTGTLTGHIDLLRYEKNDMIGIWDYKPRAKYEKKAHVQVYLYALMLSRRTRLPLNRFLCGYFDSKSAYYFNASDVSLNQ